MSEDLTLEELEVHAQRAAQRAGIRSERRPSRLSFETPAELGDVVRLAAQRSMSLPRSEMPPPAGEGPRHLAPIPREHAWARFSAPELGQRTDRGAWPALHRALEGVPKTVLLTGHAGTGKTTLATAAYRQLLEACAHRTGLWVPVATLVTEATRESRLGEEPRVLGQARRCSVLLLDDLGAEHRGDLSRSTVDGIISGRHREQRWTIVTSGLSAEQMLERYGAGVHRRLTEPGRSSVVVLRGGRA